MAVDEWLARVLAAWSATPWLNDPNAGAPEADIETAEARLGRSLPAAMRELYSALNGGSMLEGYVNLLPLLSDSGKLALTTASGLLRSWEWPVPDELVIFGDEGADDQLGIWLPATGTGRPIVISMGAVEERSFAVVGDDLPGFLLALRGRRTTGRSGTGPAGRRDARPARVPGSARPSPDPAV